MAQATTLPPAPAGYGSAFREVLEVVRALTADQITTLNNVSEHLQTDAAHQQAVERFEAAFELVDGGIAQFAAEGKLIITAPGGALAALYAVLLRDRGLITAADFTIITDPWTTAGLPLPAAVTGDEALGTFTAIAEMTSDLIADELLHAAAGTAQYGAVLVLTGYNHGELLAYPCIRKFVERHEGGALKIDWNSVAIDHAMDLLEEELGEDATDFLTVALAMLPDGELGVDVTDDNAEVLTLATAYTTGATSLLNPRWETQDDVQTLNPAVASAPTADGSGA